MFEGGHLFSGRNPEQEDRTSFLPLMRKMLQWEREKRSSAKELMEDEWLCKHTGGK